MSVMLPANLLLTIFAECQAAVQKQTLLKANLVLVAATPMFVGTTSCRRRNQHLISSVTINTTVSCMQPSHGDGRDTFFLC
jgi:hypothetical protein